MGTDCSTIRMEFKPLGGRKVVADFAGGQLTSDAGVLLLMRLDQHLDLLRRFAACFKDRRDPELIEHTVEDLVRQRVFALTLGYEDLNDHDELSRDPLLATVVGKDDPSGDGRLRDRDKGRPLAGKSTLNRMELTPEKLNPDNRYQKITLDFAAVEALLVDVFLEAYTTIPAQVILDLDATDDPIHGQQEGRFFHGYYKEYCYLPLYVFCGEHLLCAQLRSSNIDASAGTEEVLERLVSRIRQRWPGVRIIVRGDSGFARDGIMAWCEAHQVDYVLGLAKNSRLVATLEGEMAQAKSQWEQTRQASRVFKDFVYRTRDSWSCERRVVGKAEHLDNGANPRFVVTSLPVKEWDARGLYEDLYCARGEMENRIKEQQLCLFADRTSCGKMRANQIRLWFSSMAYVLTSALRRLGLAGTELASARCDTIRLKLLKIGAAVRISVRRVLISIASSFPLKELFQEILRRLESLPMRC